MFDCSKYAFRNYFYYYLFIFVLLFLYFALYIPLNFIVTLLYERKWGYSTSNFSKHTHYTYLYIYIHIHAYIYIYIYIHSNITAILYNMPGNISNNFSYSSWIFADVWRLLEGYILTLSKLWVLILMKVLERLVHKKYCKDAAKFLLKPTVLESLLCYKPLILLKRESDKGNYFRSSH